MKRVMMKRCDGTDDKNKKKKGYKDDENIERKRYKEGDDRTIRKIYNEKDEKSMKGSEAYNKKKLYMMKRMRRVRKIIIRMTRIQKKNIYIMKRMRRV